VECLQSVTGSLRDATLYVNLEPCCHYGKTPPCTEALIRAGIGRVVVGMVDPNPAMMGKGIDLLRRNGTVVVVGVCEAGCRELNRPFIRNMQSGRSYIHLKVALSIDGKLAGGQRWISSKASRELVHRWRATHDAVLVGAGTMRSDNPRLDVRHVKGRNPHVIILDGRFRVSPTSRVFSGARTRRVILCTANDAVQAHRARARRVVALGGEILTFPAVEGRISLRELCRTLLQQGFGSVLVEGGLDISGGFLAEGVVDELSYFVAPIVLGGKAQAFQTPKSLREGGRTPGEVRSRRVGRDILLTYLFN
jgi:diaminohydroxyphosphoribosylaminopyrimidine deaminase/5-amino-6-(5-phosphoribosylamino)uracil reductase